MKKIAFALIALATLSTASFAHSFRQSYTDNAGFSSYDGRFQSNDEQKDRG